MDVIGMRDSVLDNSNVKVPRGSEGLPVGCVALSALYMESSAHIAVFLDAFNVVNGSESSSRGHYIVCSSEFSPRLADRRATVAVLCIKAVPSTRQD